MRKEHGRIEQNLEQIRTNLPVVTADQLTHTRLVRRLDKSERADMKETVYRVNQLLLRSALPQPAQRLNQFRHPSDWCLWMLDPRPTHVYGQTPWWLLCCTGQSSPNTWRGEGRAQPDLAGSEEGAHEAECVEIFEKMNAAEGLLSTYFCGNAAALSLRIGHNGLRHYCRCSRSAADRALFWYVRVNVTICDWHIWGGGNPWLPPNAHCPATFPTAVSCSNGSPELG